MSSPPSRTPAYQPPGEDREPVSDAERSEALSRVLDQNLREGWRLDQQSDFSAAISKGKEPDFVLHLLLTLLTAGLWGIVWIILAITKHEDHRCLRVDLYGKVAG